MKPAAEQLRTALLFAAAAGVHVRPCGAEPLGPPELEEVTVSAKQRQEPVLGLPNSVAVVSAELLSSSGAGTLDEMQASVAGFSVEKINGYGNVAIRGIGGGGRNIGFETRTGIYLDEVYVGQPQALGLPLYDVQRIEILRGPQGYLYGRNTVSGAVNIVTRLPDDTLTGAFRVALGNERLRESDVRVSGPLGEHVAGSLAAVHERRDGFSRNLAGGELDDAARTALRARMRFTPGAATTLDLHADLADLREDTVVTGEPLTDFFDTPSPELPRAPRTFDIDAPSFEKVRAHGANATVVHLLPGGHVLTAVTGARLTKQARQNDTDYSRNDLLWVDYRERYRQWSEELRIASPARARLRYLGGIHFLYEDAAADRRAVIGEDTATVVPLPNGARAAFGAALRVAPGDGAVIASRIGTRSRALFGGLDYDLTRRLNLSVGARYTRETKSLRHDLDGSRSGGFGIAVVTDYVDRRSDAAWTPSLGLRFAVAERINAYANYRSGFKSGGWNLDFLSSAQADAGFVFGDETVDAYELGLKADFMTLSFDVALFRADYRDHQVFQSLTQPSGQTVFVLTNAARARAQGVDASVVKRFSDWLAVSFSLELLDARYREFLDGGGPGVDFNGNRLQSAPHGTGTAVLDYAVPAAGGELTVHVQYGYRGSSYTHPANRPLDRLDPRRIADARITWQPAAKDSWRVSLWARNLLDEQYLARRGRDFLGNQYWKLGEPRTYGIDVAYDF